MKNSKNLQKTIRAFAFSILLSFTTTLLSAQSFIKKIGDDTDEEGATSIISDGNGNFIIAGYRNNNAVLLGMDPSGNIIWQDQFKLTGSTKRDVISDIKLDGNNIIACGYGKASSGSNDDAFVFQYNFTTNTINWATIDPGTVNRLTRYYSVTIIGGNYFLTGTINGTHTEGYIRVVDNTGALLTTWQVHAGTTNQADDFLFADTDGNDFYFGGRVFRGGSSLCNSRIMMSRLNPTTGGFNWSNAYHAVSTTSRRMYGQDLDLNDDNDEIILAGSGSTTTTGGCNPTSYDMYLARTDLTGAIIADRNLAINGYSNTIPREVLAYNGGYIIMGQAYNTGNDRDLFLMGVNSNLEEQWTELYGGVGIEDVGYNSNNQMLIDANSGYIYFVGRSASYSGNGSQDMMVVKTDLLGFIADDCNAPVETDNTALTRVVDPFTWTNQTLTNLDVPDSETDVVHTLACDIVCGCVSDVGGSVPNPDAEKELSPEEALDQSYNQDLPMREQQVNWTTMEVFPNPAQNLLEVKVTSVEPVSQVRVTDVTGKVLVNNRFHQDQTNEIDVSGLENGTYIITLVTEKGVEFSQNFIKQD